MKLAPRSLVVVIIVIVSLGLCGTADAALVTLGPSLAGSWIPEECGLEACAFINVPEPTGAGEGFISPIDGTIVRWSVVGGITPGTFQLRTALRYGNRNFTFLTASAPEISSSTPGVQTFTTDLPVGKGTAIGLSMSETASLGFREGGGQVEEWGFEPPQSGNSAAEELYPGLTAGFNAVIQPAPTIGSLSPTTVGTAGGTPVTISGTDFENATAVKFGDASASFTIDSEGQLTAIAPAGSVGNVAVTVTTVAGTATASQNLTYEAPAPSAPTVQQPVVPPPPSPVCVVPKLIGRSLAATKRALAKADCKLGSAKMLPGATAKTGKVSRQGSKPGSRVPAGSKIAVSLKPASITVPKHKRGHRTR